MPALHASGRFLHSIPATGITIASPNTLK